MQRGKVDPGVSELPRGNELSRDHVNRPIDGYDDSECNSRMLREGSYRFFLSRKAYSVYSVEKTYFSTNIFMNI